MNLYAALSDNADGYERYAMLVFAESRGKARYALWRAFGSMDESLHETRYVIRLVEKDRSATAGIIESDTPETHALWALAKERTGIWQEKDE